MSWWIQLFKIEFQTIIPNYLNQTGPNKSVPPPGFTLVNFDCLKTLLLCSAFFERKDSCRVEHRDGILTVCVVVEMEYEIGCNVINKHLISLPFKTCNVKRRKAVSHWVSFYFMLYSCGTHLSAVTHWIWLCTNCNPNLLFHSCNFKPISDLFVYWLCLVDCPMVSSSLSLILRFPVWCLLHRLLLPFLSINHGLLRTCSSNTIKL